MLMYYGTNNRDAYILQYEHETSRDTVRLVRVFEIDGYEVPTHNSPQPRKVIHLESQ
jgi:hypothetical protein